MNLLKVFRVGVWVAVGTISAHAQYHWYSPTPRPTRTGRASVAFPDVPDVQKDTDIVIDEQQDLDRYTGNATKAALKISIPIKRYVGPVGTDGHLLNVNSLISNGVVTPYAIIRFPIYDVDFNGNPTDPSIPVEMDYVVFNGKSYGTITPENGLVGGGNDVWGMFAIKVPISELKFPSRGASGVNGGEPIAALNKLEIQIDVLNGGWATSIDWVELKFGAVAPIILVHGMGSQGDSWKNNPSSGWNCADGTPSGTPFVSFYDSMSADYLGPWTNDINLGRASSIASNNSSGMLTDSLGNQLKNQAKNFGAKSCHIIAHSKGGLDTRYLLNSSDYDPQTFRILSLYTLSTPHKGSVLADVLAETGTLAVVYKVFCKLPSTLGERVGPKERPLTPVGLSLQTKPTKENQWPS